MTGRYPEIPSTTKKEQDELCEKLMIETRKREMSQQAGLGRGASKKDTKGSARNDRENYRCHWRR